MPRIDPQEFEKRAQRLRKAADAVIEAEAAQRAANEALKAARAEHQSAEEHHLTYIREMTGAKTVPF